MLTPVISAGFSSVFRSFLVPKTIEHIFKSCPGAAPERPGGDLGGPGLVPDVLFVELGFHVSRTPCFQNTMYDK